MSEKPEHAPDCANPNAEPEVGFGLAGGGYGAYTYCPHCYAILDKVQELPEEFQ